MLRSVIFLTFIISFSLFGFENVYNCADMRADKDQIIMLRNQGFDLIRESLKKIDGVYSFQAYITDKQVSELKGLGFDPKLITDERTKEDKSAGYHTNESIGLEFDSLEAVYPTLCKRIQLGTSVLGRPLWALKISDNVTEDEAEPEFKYVSTMHGIEVTGIEMCMNLIGDILDGYKASVDTMQFLVNNTEIYIMPLMNPDGMALQTRANANGIVLSADFPDWTKNDYNTPLKKQPETAAIINWNNERNFVLSANFHTGIVLVNYPWDSAPGIPDGEYAACPDDATFIWLSRGYADRNPEMTIFDNGITNGCDWFSTFGDMQDWNYYYYNDMDVIIELSDVGWPDFSDIPRIWANNRTSMLWYMMAVHKGIKGTVTDSSTGEPLEAIITIDGIEKDYFSNAHYGDYYKILKPGTYSLKASLSGYSPKYFTDIVVKDSLATVLNIELDSIKVGMGDKVHLPEKVILEQNYPNPFNPSTTIRFSVPSVQNVKLSIFNSKWQLVENLIDKKIDKGFHEVKFDADDLISGIYFYSLETNGNRLTQKMLLIK